MRLVAIEFLEAMIRRYKAIVADLEETLRKVKALPQD